MRESSVKLSHVRARVAGLGVLLLLGALLGTAPPAAGAAGVASTAAQPELPGVFLSPPPEQIVTGTTDFFVHYDGPPGTVMAFWINWTEPGGSDQWFMFDRDAEGQDLGLGGHLEIDTPVPGIWTGQLMMPPGHPPGLADIWAQAFQCEVPDVPATCQFHENVTMQRMWADGTPTQPFFMPPSPETVVPAGQAVTIEVEVTDPTDSPVDLFLAALFPKGKGLPRANQHVVGVDFAGQRTNGDMSCAPTAAASSLSWFAQSKFPALQPAGRSLRDMVKDIGTRAGTGANGTAPARCARAIRDYVKAAGLEDQITVSEWERFGDGSKPIDRLAHEYGRGQDVLIGVYWDGGGGHALAVEGIQRNADGTATVTVMDPWTGTYETISTDAAGKGKLGDKGLRIGGMVHVSPTQRPEQKVGEATPAPGGGSTSSTYSQDGETVTFTVDTTGMIPGRYLLRAAATDPAAQAIDGTVQPLTLSDHHVVQVDGVARLSGTDRILTGIEVSRASYAGGDAQAVVLARSDLFPDALAGTPLAIARFAPLLLTPPASLDARVEAEIARVLPAGGTVYLLGGTAALSAAVADRLAELGYQVVRYAGENRFATAVQVAQQGLGDPGTLMVASGGDFPDALAGGAAAGIVGGAVLLTAGDLMPADTAAYLAARPEAQRFAIGGPAARADQTATPVVGRTRFETAVAVAERFVPNPPAVGVATGGRFPDALTGGVHVGRRGGPIVLSGDSALPDVLRDYLAANRASIGAGYLYGGAAALTSDVEAAVAEAIR